MEKRKTWVEKNCTSGSLTGFELFTMIQQIYCGRVAQYDDVSPVWPPLIKIWISVNLPLWFEELVATLCSRTQESLRVHAKVRQSTLLFLWFCPIVPSVFCCLENCPSAQKSWCMCSWERQHSADSQAGRQTWSTAARHLHCTASFSRFPSLVVSKLNSSLWQLRAFDWLPPSGTDENVRPTHRTPKPSPS